MKTFRKAISSAGVVVFIGLFLFLAYRASHEAPEPDRPTMGKTGVQEFDEYVAAIQGLPEGYDRYPPHTPYRAQQAALARVAHKRQDKLNWMERGPSNVGGRTRAFVLDPADTTNNTFYVGGVGGGIWRGVRNETFVGGETVTWTPLADHLPSLAVGAIGISPDDPSIIYMGTGEGFFNADALQGYGMFKSMDRGATWEHLQATAKLGPNEWQYINDIKVNPDDADELVVISNQSIFRSMDGGMTFDKTHSSTSQFNRIQDLEVDPTDWSRQYAAIGGTGVIRSMDAGRTWEEVLTNPPPEAGRIELAIAPSDPMIIYGANDVDGGRLLRSVNGGDTWEFMLEDASATTPWMWFGWYCNALAVDPYNPDRVFMASVFRWEANMLNTVVLNRFFANFTITDADYIGTVEFGLSPFAGVVPGNTDYSVREMPTEEMRSVEIRFDDKQMAHRYTWEDISFVDYVDVPFTVWDKESGEQLEVAFMDSQNDGEFNLIHENRDGPFSQQSREYLYVTKYRYDGSAPHPIVSGNEGIFIGRMYILWLYLNEGYTWDPENLTGTINIDYPEQEYRGFEVKSVDDASVHGDYHDITIVPVKESEGLFEMWTSNDGGVAFSYNSGEDWIETDEYGGYNTTQFYDAVKAPGEYRYIGGTQDNATQISFPAPDMDAKYREVLPGDGFDAIWHPDGRIIGTNQYNNIWRSSTGSNWKNISTDRVDDEEKYSFFTTLGWSIDMPDRIVTTSSVGIWQSEDFGDSWNLTAISSNLWEGGQSAKARVSLADPEVIWAGYRLRDSNSRSSLWISRDGGQEFFNVPSVEIAPTAIMAGMATHPVEAATAYVTYAVSEESKILRTTNYGRDWEDITQFNASGVSENGFENVQVYDLAVLPERPETLIAGTNVGIFQSNDDGATWEYNDTGLPATGIWRVRAMDDELVLATHGRGIWTVPLDEFAIGDRTSTESEELPGGITLSGYYPNPFTRTTTLDYTLPRTAHVRLLVFDVLGRQVAVLQDETRQHGAHSVTWDAQAMTSGQYFVRMETDGNLVASHAVTLVK